MMIMATVMMESMVRAPAICTPPQIFMLLRTDSKLLLMTYYNM